MSDITQGWLTKRDAAVRRAEQLTRKLAAVSKRADRYRKALERVVEGEDCCCYPDRKSVDIPCQTCIAKEALRGEREEQA